MERKRYTQGNLTQAIDQFEAGQLVYILPLKSGFPLPLLLFRIERHYIIIAFIHVYRQRIQVLQHCVWN